METFNFQSLITDGKLHEAVSKQIASALRLLEGKRVTVEIKEVKRRRSLSQNSYMWGVVIRMITQAFRDAGNSVDDDDVFSFMKSHVWKLKQVFVTPEGEVLSGPGSTRIWTTQEMEVRLEEARAWAAEMLGVAIPLPNECLTSA